MPIRRTSAYFKSVRRALRWPHKRRSPLTPAGRYRLDRSRILAALALLLFGVTIVRALFLQTQSAPHPSLANMADRQYLQALKTAPFRGGIFDRKGEPFAISVKKTSLAVNPRVFAPDQGQLRNLSSILGMSVEALKEIDRREAYFAWVKRKLPDSVIQRVRNLSIPGLHEISEPSRFYPAGTTAAQLIGLTGLDNQGLLGVERIFDKELQGKSVLIEIAKDGRHRQIFLESSGVEPEKSGNNVYLTIDRAIQEIAEEELASGIAIAKAKQGFAIVVDPHTGKILALANFPTFNPNHFERRSMHATFNYALNGLFEPGSVTKPLVIAAALEESAVHQDSLFNCENGIFRIGKHRIRDTTQHETLSVTDTLVHSSNICTYKIAQQLGTKHLYGYLKKFGLASGATKLGYPGEETGRLDDWQKWREIRFANIAFGQGMMTTGMELVSAISAIANGGNLIKPMLVERIESSERSVLSSQTSEVLHRVIRPQTAQIVRQMMRSVVEHPRGSGQHAKNDWYSVAGKTGTAQKADTERRGYSPDKRIASFIAFAPVEDPYLTVYVVVDEPGIKPYYGGKWAAPIVKNIVTRSLRYLNVPPDKLIPGPGEDGLAKSDEQHDKKAL